MQGKIGKTRFHEIEPEEHEAETHEEFAELGELFCFEKSNAQAAYSQQGHDQVLDVQFETQCSHQPTRKCSAYIGTENHAYAIFKAYNTRTCKGHYQQRHHGTALQQGRNQCAGQYCLNGIVGMFTQEFLERPARHGFECFLQHIHAKQEQTQSRQQRPYFYISVIHYILSSTKAAKHNTTTILKVSTNLR